ncbi:hypothetical protein ABD91_20940 [Lysinibacillus sphaericus]|uniref:hypothetical protein n=1 Tax=Lysinibacillus sphaericus TaxID=1421 RepID=UPI0018CECB5A|nr:hypothetical protein [Lysinibacillus sphaericus]MBG9693209.1 hypothetical protein [Lysinibacillus sphaericus]
MKSEFLKEVLSRFTEQNRATYTLGLMAKHDDFKANQAEGGKVTGQKAMFFGFTYLPASESYICYQEGEQETIAMFHESDHAGMSEFLNNFIISYDKNPIFCYLELPISYSQGKLELDKVLEANSGLKIVEMDTRGNSKHYLIKASYTPSLQSILNMVRNYLYTTPNKDVVMNRETLKETMFVIDVDPMEFHFTHR